MIHKIVKKVRATVVTAGCLFKLNFVAWENNRLIWCFTGCVHSNCLCTRHVIDLNKGWTTVYMYLQQTMIFVNKKAIR